MTSVVTTPQAPTRPAATQQTTTPDNVRLMNIQKELADLRRTSPLAVPRKLTAHGFLFLRKFLAQRRQSLRLVGMTVIVFELVGAMLTSHLQAQTHVSFSTADSGIVYADLYGKGEHGVVLAHGGRFNKESWGPQAKTLAAAGFRVLAIDFRGYGQSHGPGQTDPLSASLHFDVLAAIRYLREIGAKTVSVIGGSMGGGAAAEASIGAKPGEIERLVLLAPMAVSRSEHIKGRKLFVIARQDTNASGTPRLVKMREQFDQAPAPKEMMILEGYAHAQLLFQTEQGERLMREIIRFLSEK